MKKNICPYIDFLNRCTHKTIKLTSKLPDCQFNNPLKCNYYNEWLDRKKRQRKLPKGVLNDIKDRVEEYKRRWVK